MHGPTRPLGAQALAALLLLLLSGCGEDTPTGPTPLPLSISCPANQAVTTPDGRPAATAYPAPVVTGGRAPVSTQCAPASGTVFPLGTTTVTCTATDAAQQTRSCAFTVTLSPPPYLRFVRFLAFGDSLTWGTRAFYIDGASVLYLVGSTMDWVEDDFTAGFVFANPNAKGACGCGESFMV